MTDKYKSTGHSLDPIGDQASNATSAPEVAELLERLADLHEDGEFDFTNSDMVSFLRGLSTAVRVFEGEPEGKYANIAKQGQWRVLAEIINMALELE